MSNYLSNYLSIFMYNVHLSISLSLYQYIDTYIQGLPRLADRQDRLPLWDGEEGIQGE